MIKQEDLPLLRKFLELLKIPATRSISIFETYEIMYGVPLTNKVDFDIPRAEFKRISNIFIQIGIAETDNNDYGPLLKPNLKTYAADIDVIYNELLEKQNRNKKKNKSEDRQQTLTGWKYYTFWPIFAFAAFGGGYSTYNIIKNLTTTEDVKQLQTPKVEKKVKQFKQQTIPLYERK